MRGGVFEEGDGNVGGIGAGGLERNNGNVGGRRSGGLEEVMDLAHGAEDWEEADTSGEDEESANSEGPGGEVMEDTLFGSEAGDDSGNGRSGGVEGRKRAYLDSEKTERRIHVNSVDESDHENARAQSSVILERLRVAFGLTEDQFENDSLVSSSKLFTALLPERALVELAGMRNGRLSSHDMPRTRPTEMLALLRAIFTAALHHISASRLCQNLGRCFKVDGLLIQSRARLLLKSMQGAPPASANGRYPAAFSHDESLSALERLLGNANSKMPHVPGLSKLSADDDMRRGRPRELTSKSGARKATAPGKGAGFAIATLTEPCLGVAFGARAAKVGETNHRTIQHLLMMVKRAGHPEDVSFNNQCAIFVDRGCMGDKMIQHFDSCGLLSLAH